MFVRIKRSGSGERTHEYLQLVVSRREGPKVRQSVLATLGRLDVLTSSGQVDSLLHSLSRFSQRLRVVDATRAEGLQARQALSWGPALIFQRLWERQGLPEILRSFAKDRQFGFDVERACFALALQRLCAPGSDLHGSKWLQTVYGPGLEPLALQHLYRTVGGFLPPIREDLEHQLFLQDRDLFSQELDLVFIDTTSTFLSRDEETPLLKRGYSRDHRPDQPQVMICLAVDRQGWPIAWDLLPGNTADPVSFRAMIERLRTRFAIRKVIAVADRGMIGKETIQALTGHKTAPFDFILGCRMRQQKEVNETVLSRAGRYREVQENLDVKEVRVDGRRYVICRNPAEARKDAAARAALVAKLEETLAHGPKSLMGNKGYARFLTVKKGSVSLNAEAIEADARLDGKYVLRTNTELPTDEVALAYKSLWRVERAFRETKSTLEVRPVFHHRDDTTTGHIMACFLALRLEVDLQRRLDERGVEASWPDLMRDLDQVKAVTLDFEGVRYRLRTDLQGVAHEAFKAAGVAVPRPVQEVGPAPPVEDARGPEM